MAVRLKEFRFEKRFTQQQIAAMLNIRKQSYTRHECGTSKPLLDTLLKITNLFGVSTDYLLDLRDY